MIINKSVKIVAIVLIVAGAFYIILFRNTPHFVKTEKHDQPSTEPNAGEFLAPSKANVAAAFTEQVTQLKKSIEQNSSNVSHLKMLTQLLMDGHQHKEAIVYFEKAVSLQPHNDSLLLDLSVCYFNDHNYEKALQTTEKILKNNKYHSRALYNKGAILATEGKKTEAMNVWNVLLQRDPNSDEAKTVREHNSLLEKK